ncbi:hypothetical protein D3C85_1712480 [compost metagenome]
MNPAPSNGSTRYKIVCFGERWRSFIYFCAMTDTLTKKKAERAPKLTNFTALSSEITSASKDTTLTMTMLMTGVPNFG